MKFIFNTVYYLTFFSVILLTSLLLMSFFPFKDWYQIKVVLSGSMEPNIKTGSIIVIKPEKNYKVGDVVTFGRDDRVHVPITHRIVEIDKQQDGGEYFVTKGDANEDIDAGQISKSSVIGRVLFTLPYVGYFLSFMKTNVGFISVVVIPGIIVLLIESYKIWLSFVRQRKS